MKCKSPGVALCVAAPSLAVVLLFVDSMASVGNTESAPSKRSDPAKLRRLFSEAAGDHFDVVKDELTERSPARGGGSYWLVFAKPKRIGHFAIKYTFKYDDKFYGESEHELYIRVLDRGRSRHSRPDFGVSNVCLGDTVVVPILTNRAFDHEFSIKWTYEEPEKPGAGDQESTDLKGNLPDSGVSNPLTKHLRYLGTSRAELLHRNSGVTVVHSATFQATSPGRFNLGLAMSQGNASAPERSRMSPAGSTPIIVVEPGTPITALVWKEQIINYAKGRTFSSEGGNNFLTNLMILQPGDVFSLDYASSVYRRDLDRAHRDSRREGDVKPLIQRFPFALDRSWSFNEWIADYLPPEN